MIYHYTKHFHLRSILERGLLPSSLLLTPAEKPINWFTTNAQWEPTVFAVVAPSLQDAHEYERDHGGLIRIVCEDSVAPYRWKELKEIAHIPGQIAKVLYDAAILVGSRPGEWRGSLEVVPVEKFVAIEFFDGRDWVTASQYKPMAA